MPAFAPLAYPALLGAIYGAYRVGRGRRLESAFEKVWACSLGILVGLQVFVTARLVLAGRVTGTLGLLAGALGVAACLALLVLAMRHMLHPERARLASP